jgi:hypothetical protein
MTITRTASQNWKGKMTTCFHQDGTKISYEQFVYVLSLYTDWTETTERTKKGWRDVWVR